jgi:hypothetical protein
MKSNTIKALSAVGALALAAALPATSYAAEDNSGLIMDWNQAPHAPTQASPQPTSPASPAAQKGAPATAGSTAFIMDWNQAPHALTQASPQPNVYVDSSVAAAGGNNDGHAAQR